MKSHQFEPKVKVATDPSILLRAGGGIKCVDKDGKCVIISKLCFRTARIDPKHSSPMKCYKWCEFLQPTCCSNSILPNHLETCFSTNASFALQLFKAYLINLSKRSSWSISWKICGALNFASIFRRAWKNQEFVKIIHMSCLFQLVDFLWLYSCYLLKSKKSRWWSNMRF